MVLPIRVWGTDSAGKAFNALAYTLDISPSGARLCGMRVPLALGEAVTVQYKQKRALFKVAWVGQPGKKTAEQVGIQTLEPDKHIWLDLPGSETFVDDFDRSRRSEEKAKPAIASPPAAAQPQAAAAPAPAATVLLPQVSAAPACPAETSDDLNACLRSCTTGLIRIEEMIKKGPAEATAIEQFRQAVSKTRQTAWAVQQWQELNREGTQPFPLLWYVNSERLRFVVQAVQDLWKDVNDKGVEVDETLLEPLFQTLDALRDRYAAKHPLATDVTADLERALGSGAGAAQKMEEVRQLVESAHMDVDSALNYLATQVHRIVGADGVTVAVADQGEMVCLASVGVAPEPGMVLDTDSGIGADALSTRQMVYCRDTQSDPRVDAASCAAAGVGSVLVMPAVAGGMPVAMLEISAHKADAFDEDRLQAVRAAAEVVQSVVAKAMQNTR